MSASDVRRHAAWIEAERAKALLAHAMASRQSKMTRRSQDEICMVNNLTKCDCAVVEVNSTLGA
jgi:hypothetical protein